MTDDEWLLISAAEIVDVPVDEWATVNVLERFVPLFGRLIIKCRKGNTFQGMYSTSVSILNKRV